MLSRNDTRNTVRVCILLSRAVSKRETICPSCDTAKNVGNRRSAVRAADENDWSPSGMEREGEGDGQKMRYDAAKENPLIVIYGERICV